MLQFFASFVPPPAQRPQHAQMPSSQPAAHASSKDELYAGAIVQMGKHTFRVTKPLGKGSFSTVWSAVRADGSNGNVEIAIKETMCRTPGALSDAENEFKIMDQIGDSSRRIPDMIAMETTPVVAGTSVVRVAMTQVPGESLGGFLNCWKQQLGGVPCGHPQALANQFSEACNWTCELISQLLPAFEAISLCAVHRDVNTHNILVKTAGPVDLSSPQFGLIDFGLAAEAERWARLSTEMPVVGDCRYWPVSAWFMFAAGGLELAKQPALLMEYRTQLDVHALGITALQIFIEMLPLPAPGSAAASVVPEGIWTLKRAWEHYWQDAYSLWEPLFTAFESKTDWAQIRQNYLSSRVDSVIADDLAKIRQALANLRDASYLARPGSLLFGTTSVFAALLELISQGGHGLPGELMPGAMKQTTWQSIRSILAPGTAAGASGNSTSRGRLWAPTPSRGRSGTTTPASVGPPRMSMHMAPPGTSTQMPPHFQVSAVSTSTPYPSPWMRPRVVHVC